MANVYGHLHWVLDTAGVVTTDKVRIQKINWVPNVTTDDLILKDNNGEVIFQQVAIADNYTGEASLDFGPAGHDFLGFDVDTIDGGTIYVYLK